MFPLFEGFLKWGPKSSSLIGFSIINHPNHPVLLEKHLSIWGYPHLLKPRETPPMTGALVPRCAEVFLRICALDPQERPRETASPTCRRAQCEALGAQTHDCLVCLKMGGLSPHGYSLKYGKMCSKLDFEVPDFQTKPGDLMKCHGI